MKVIFIQNVAKQGQIGEAKEVAAGYATNVLFPKQQAILATSEAIKKLEREKKTKAHKKESEKSTFLKTINNLQEILEKESRGYLEISDHKKDKNGHLFSQVKEADIIDAIYKKIKLSLNPRQIFLPKEPIKKVGEYSLNIKDGDFIKQIKIKIV